MPPVAVIVLINKYRLWCIILNACILQQCLHNHAASHSVPCPNIPSAGFCSLPRAQIQQHGVNWKVHGSAPLKDSIAQCVNSSVATWHVPGPLLPSAKLEVVIRQTCGLQTVTLIRAPWLCTAPRLEGKWDQRWGFAFTFTLMWIHQCRLWPPSLSKGVQLALTWCLSDALNSKEWWLGVAVLLLQCVYYH